MSEQVRIMFANISEDYDKMNDILSFRLHRLWRKKVVSLADLKGNEKILDCASGTGDLALEFKKHLRKESLVKATDFCSEMLELIPAKAQKLNLEVDIEEADVQNLPYEDNFFDVATISFGIRNVDSTKLGLSEMARVVKPGGKVIILETGQPKGINKLFYNIYGTYIMPLLGKLIAKNEAAYTYLPQTASKFPYAEEFTDIMNSTAQFSSVKYIPQTFGVAYIYVGIVK